MADLFELKYDVYGSKARASAIADLIELSCLHGRSVTESFLEDWLEDAGWDIGSREDFSGAEVRDYGSNAKRVFALLRIRNSLLGEKYPFEVGDRLALKTGGDANSPYLALLATTMSHGYSLASKVAGSPTPTRVFEDTVAQAIGSRGLLAINFGGLRRSAGNFRNAVDGIANDLELVTNSDAPTYRNAAQDEGVDIVAHLTWSDRRHGAWTFIGQATCAMSDEWPKKMKEPSRNLWKDLLGTGAFPVSFLAVPHHIEPDHLRYLVGLEGDWIVDRIRLVVKKTTISTDEIGLIDVIRRFKPDWG